MKYPSDFISFVGKGLPSASEGACKHVAALYVYVNEERTTSKTDKEQQWSTPSQRLQLLYPKGETVTAIYGGEGSSERSFHVQEGKDDQHCKSLAEDLEKCGLKNSSLFKSLTVDTSNVPEDAATTVPVEVHPMIENMIKSGGISKYLNLPQVLASLPAKSLAFYKRTIVKGTDDNGRFMTYKNTMGQAENKNWFAARENRISASRARAIGFAQKDSTLMTYFFGSLVSDEGDESAGSRKTKKDKKHVDLDNFRYTTFMGYLIAQIYVMHELNWCKLSVMQLILSDTGERWNLSRETHTGEKCLTWLYLNRAWSSARVTHGFALLLMASSLTQTATLWF